MDLEEHSERRVLPIWNESGDAVSLPELTPVVEKKKVDYKYTTADVIAEFRESPNEGVAIDLLNTSFLERNEEGLELAVSYLRDKSQLPVETARILRICTGVEVDSIDKEYPITKLRRRIRQESKNPLPWVDLAREFTKRGDQREATRAMVVALDLAKGHRWITRVAARFFVHFNQPDRAQSILLKNPSSTVDPWLVATEIAVAQIAEVDPRLWNSGKKILARGYRHLHISELASSMATLEFSSGAIKKSKPLFQESLLDPNKTTLAQAKWVERNSNMKLVGRQLEGRTEAFEAQFWEAHNNQEMELALVFSRKWLDEEPYSSKAAISASVTAALLDDYDELEVTTQLGLMANPNDLTLRLNHIYSWLAKSEPNSPALYLDNMKFEYEKRLLVISDAEDWCAAHASANLGMFYYRTNRLELGWSFYTKSEERFLAEGSSSSAMMALLNHAREAIIASSPRALELLIRVEGLLQKPGSHNTASSVFYARKLARLAKDPAEWRTLLRDNSIPKNVEGEKVNLRTPAPRFELDGRNATIWLPKGFKADK